MFDERIPGNDYHRQVFLHEATGDDDGEPLLELTAFDGDEQTTVRLSLYGVRELRLALARFERRKKAE